ncbi:MAG TPA: S8 family serine peptidase, partial [Candidatus Limnocylindrales bacterium]|nr:S8 family serine peptidase [Candidatus Limnocylindrales bacterium]
MKKQILILSFIVLLGGAGAWNFLKAPVDTQPPPVTSVPQTVPVHTPEASSSDEPVAAPSASAHVPNSSENPSAAEAMPAGDAPIVYIDEKPYPLRTYKPLVLPNDPSADQWWVTQTGLDKAWDIPRGSGETVLAIIDTGFGLKHEEFANRWHTNSGESGITATEDPSSLNCTGRSLPISAACNLIDDNGDSVVDNETGTAIYENPSRLNCTDQGKLLDKSCNRVDDEGNGFVDDTTGWDFINYDNSVQAGELNPTGSGTTHGTLVAGVAAATGNNAKGIAGVDWGTKIMPLQALDDDSYGDTRSVGRAINYAVKQGVDVISLSLGSDSPDPYVETAVQAATAAGILVLAASGNDGCDCISYPARYSEVIAVGALNTSSLPASFSSFGAGLDILAPGTSITTSTWSNTNPTSAYASGVSGTSFATPLAAGLATRLLS